MLDCPCQPQTIASDPG